MECCAGCGMQQVDEEVTAHANQHLSEWSTCSHKHFIRWSDYTEKVICKPSPQVPQYTVDARAQLKSDTIAAIWTFGGYYDQDPDPDKNLISEHEKEPPQTSVLTDGAHTRCSCECQLPSCASQARV